MHPDIRHDQRYINKVTQIIETWQSMIRAGRLCSQESDVGRITTNFFDLVFNFLSKTLPPHRSTSGTELQISCNTDCKRVRTFWYACIAARWSSRFNSKSKCVITSSIFLESNSFWASGGSETVQYLFLVLSKYISNGDHLLSINTLMKLDEPWKRHWFVTKHFCTVINLGNASVVVVTTFSPSCSSTTCVVGA